MFHEIELIPSCSSIRIEIYKYGNTVCVKSYKIYEIGDCYYLD